MAGLLHQLKLGVRISPNACLSPDERNLAVATIQPPSFVSVSLIARICDVASLSLWSSGLSCATASGHHCCCFSPDSKWLVVGGCNDLTSCHCIYDFRALTNEHKHMENKYDRDIPSVIEAIHLEPLLHHFTASSLVFTPDSNKLVSLMNENYSGQAFIRVWDLQGLEPNAAVDGQFTCKSFTDFHPQNMVHKISQTTACIQFPSDKQRVHCMKLSSNGRTLAYLCKGHIYIIDIINSSAYLLADNDTKATLPSSEFITCDFNSLYGGSELVTGSSNGGEIVFWKLEESNASFSRATRIHMNNFIIKVSPDGILLAACECTGKTLIMNYTSNDILWMIESHELLFCSTPCSFLFTKDCRKCIICVSSHGNVQSWSLPYVASLSHLCCVVLCSEVAYMNVELLPIPHGVITYVKNLYM